MDQRANPDERHPSVLAAAAVRLVVGLACPLGPHTHQSRR